MNVLHISTADLRHGAGRAAYRLHCGLRKSGIGSKMLVAEKTSIDSDIISLDRSDNFFDSVIRFGQSTIELGLNTCGIQSAFSFFTKNLNEHPFVKEADVIHCHNLHWPFKNFSLSFLNNGLQKPLIWTFHDMWPITGHCYHSFECSRWRDGCGKGCRLSTFIPIAWNSSALQWIFKKKLYAQTSFQIVAPSSWMVNMSKESPLLTGKKVTCIPNAFNELIFTKLENRAELKAHYGFNAKDKIAIFVASNINVSLKGLNLLLDVLTKFNGEIKLIIVGKGQIPLKYHNVSWISHYGNIKQDKILNALYNLADITIVPSESDNFPGVILESMSCGTPVVAFRVGGIPDMIDHKLNGFLAEPASKQSLMEGIEYFLKNDQVRLSAGIEAREKILDLFSEEKVIAKHKMLYEQSIKLHKNS